MFVKKLGMVALYVCSFLGISHAVIDPSGPRSQIHIGEIGLGHFDGPGEVDYFDLNMPYKTPQVSIALFGHIYKTEEPSVQPLKQPFVFVERRKIVVPDDSWQRVAEAQPLHTGIEVARIQNYRLNTRYHYRIGVSTLSNAGGYYALILDPSLPEHEFEVEDLDLGTDVNGKIHALSVACSVSDPASPVGVKTVVGTDRGFVLLSNDDAKTWKQIYPPAGGRPLHGTVFTVFIDSQGIIYASPWTDSGQAVNGVKSLVIESRDGGISWSTAVYLGGPTGVGWRMAEDTQGNVFIGEYCATLRHDSLTGTTGNVWRRKNHGNNGEQFEIVFANPYDNATTKNNHVHYVGVDPYTDHVYAAIGDGGVGRFIRSKQHGDPGTWETLERGSDAQYTAITFSPNYLYLGTDTDFQHKKIKRWDKTKNQVDANEPYWTSSGMERYPSPPVPWEDKGNWFWAHYLESKNIVLMQYLPYGELMPSNLQIQPPRLYASNNDGETWWRAITFPPGPYRKTYKFGDYGPKHSSNIAPNGWIYGGWGTDSPEIHRGFRFRLVARPGGAPSAVHESWEWMK